MMRSLNDTLGFNWNIIKMIRYFSYPLKIIITMYDNVFKDDLYLFVLSDVTISDLSNIYV